MTRLFPVRALNFLLMSWLLASGAPVAWSQDPGDGASKVEFRVTRFDPGDAPPPEFRAGTGSGAVEFEVPLTHIAGPFEAPLRDGGVLDLWRAGAETPEISIRIEPQQLEHLLLVFLPRDGSFQVMKVQTPPSRLGGGDRLIVNATPGDLSFRLGDMEPLLVRPTESRVLKGPPGNEIVSLPVLIHRRENDRWELASTEQWPCDPRFRRILFAYLCPRHQQLMFHAVSERME